MIDNEIILPQSLTLQTTKQNAVDVEYGTLYNLIRNINHDTEIESHLYGD